MIIKLLATSDVHGAISPYKYSDNSLAQQGLARLSAHIERLRDENTLLIDNGDALEGNPMNFYHIAYEKNTVVDTYRTGIKDSWRKTESAFLQSTSDMEDAWNKYVKDLEKKVNECDIYELQNIISELNNINVFFENIPL